MSIGPTAFLSIAKASLLAGIVAVGMIVVRSLTIEVTIREHGRTCVSYVRRGRSR